MTKHHHKQTANTATASRRTHTLDCETRHIENIEAFAAQLAQRRFWYLQPAGQKDSKTPGHLLDTLNSLCYLNTSKAEFDTFIKTHAFSHLRAAGSQNDLATWQHASHQLWSNAVIKESMGASEASAALKKIVHAGLQDWALPSNDELAGFARASGNPHRAGRNWRLQTAAGGENFSWLTATGGVDVDEGFWGRGPESSWTGCVFAINRHWHAASNAEVWFELLTRGWQLHAPTGAVCVPASDPDWSGLPPAKLLLKCLVEGLQLCSDEKEALVLDPQRFWLHNQLAELDYTPCRLPRLDDAQLCDPEKGLWELWGEDPRSLKRLSLVARDPGADLRRRAVAIDFGTSSTVVAMDTPHGQRELLRIGVRDFFKAVDPNDFENPTVLECLDYAAFAGAWSASAYRPELNWNHMRAAHEAQASFRDNPGEVKVLASILPRLKQWALRAENSRLRLTDRQGEEIELPVHQERNPVRGKPLSVSPDAPFDPIELYAWYLGMAINWRGRRELFLKYYLSFPVRYPREVKERILASFRCGLQRSLPESLIKHHVDALNEFDVTELASEPAAYAAAALPHLGLQATATGLPYAVFDFGGGTTDFDFGLWRTATAQEEQAGYDQVFEHLAYSAFAANLDELRRARIQFTKPLDAAAFAGSEAFLAPTQAAQTNTVMLAARLREFIEGKQNHLASQIKLDLINANGDKVPCTLNLDAETLDQQLEQRMRNGTSAFLAELARIRPKLPPGTPIHVLLAGNGSRSRHIAALFATDGEDWRTLLSGAFGEAPPDIVVHPPLPIDQANPHAPTAKTGVALGLLRLAPGENTLLHNRVHERHDGQAPFAWFAGRMRRDQFEPLLHHGADYNQWVELGALQQGIFNLIVTNSPRAHAGLQAGSTELKKMPQYFPAARPRDRLFVRAIGPNKIELAAAAATTAIDASPKLALTLE